MRPYLLTIFHSFILILLSMHGSAFAMDGELLRDPSTRYDELPRREGRRVLKMAPNPGPAPAGSVGGPAGSAGAAGAAPDPDPDLRPAAPAPAGSVGGPAGSAGAAGAAPDPGDPAPGPGPDPAARPAAPAPAGSVGGPAGAAGAAGADHEEEAGQSSPVHYSMEEMGRVYAENWKYWFDEEGKVLVKKLVYHLMKPDDDEDDSLSKSGRRLSIGSDSSEKDKKDEKRIKLKEAVKQELQRLSQSDHVHFSKVLKKINDTVENKSSSNTPLEKPSWWKGLRLSIMPSITEAQQTAAAKENTAFQDQKILYEAWERSSREGDHPFNPFNKIFGASGQTDENTRKKLFRIFAPDIKVLKGDPHLNQEAAREHQKRKPQTNAEADDQAHKIALTRIKNELNHYLGVLDDTKHESLKKIITDQLRLLRENEEHFKGRSPEQEMPLKQQLRFYNDLVHQVNVWYRKINDGHPPSEGHHSTGMSPPPVAPNSLQPPLLPPPPPPVCLGPRGRTPERRRSSDSSHRHSLK